MAAPAGNAPAVYAIFNNGVSTLVANVNSTLSGVTTAVNTGNVPALNGTGGGL